MDAIDEEMYSFQDGIIKLISLVLKSFDSHKDIFMRELLSSASNALTGIRNSPFDDTFKEKRDADQYIKIISSIRENTLTIINKYVSFSSIILN